MNRGLFGVIAIAFLVLLPVWAQDGSDQDQRIADLSAAIRCPVCDGNVSVYDAVETPLGRDMLRAIETRVEAGDSDAQVLEYFVQRYGDAVLMPKSAIVPVMALSEVDARTEAVSKTLRCVVCQNQSIYDSNAPLAEDMRRLVRKRVLAGDSNDEARAYLRDRYGDYVLMTPPLQANTILLWAGPLILFGFGAIWFLLRLKSKSDRPVEALSAEDRARISAALSGEDRAS